MTESSTKKDAEDHLKTVNEQVLVLPGIDDFHKKAKIPKWKPPLQSIPDVRPQREGFPGASSVEKQKRFLRHPAYSRTIMPQKLRISLPNVHERSPNTGKLHRIITGPAASLPATELKGSRTLATTEEHMGTGSKSKQSGLGSTCTRAVREGSPPWTAKTPPPSITSRCVDHRDMMRDTTDLTPESPQNIHEQVPVMMSRYPFTIREGRINPVARDFCHFKQSFSSCWSSVEEALETLEKLLRDFAVPLAKVSGELLVQFAHGRDNGWRKAPPVNCLLSVLENWEEVSGLVSRSGQRYKGEGGMEAAATRIQSCWRRCFARTAYLRHCRRKWAAMTIAISWLMYRQVCLVKKTLQARRFRQLENHRSRAQHLAANWKHIQSSKRTIIHIPSLGYSQSQRQSMRGFDILQNIQIGRLFDIRDENVEVIYVCPRRLGDNIRNYYAGLLRCDGGARDGTDTGKTQASSCSRRFLVLTPEAVDYFPNHNMCLSTLLKYSPRTLKRIKNLIQGKQAYIVSGVAHVDDLAVADELGVPILGPEPAVAQHHSTKSGGRRIFTEAEVAVPPGQGDIYTLNQLHEVLAELMAQNMNVQRWLFKMNSEHGGRGTAYCDLCHLSCYNWALHEYHRHGPELWKVKWIQESVMLRYLDEIPEWLGRHARPAKTSRYPNWACFLKIFLRQGGVVEAYPPSDLVTCVTVDLLLEPGGEVTVVSCGDQLHGSCPLETVGSTVPQTSVDPETLLPLCRHVGQACLRRSIVGYVSVDLATFLNHNTMEQKVWAIDLDLTYSDQLAMTQMLLMMTGGTMNCRTGCLEVPMPARERCCEDQIATKPPVVNRYAVIGSHLFHSNLSILCHTGFLMICKFNGIGFNMKSKQGTVFALYDDSWRWNMGMITVSEDLQGALVTFARNLSFIHQEISTSKMQGETNFKELIKDVEGVLQRTVQNKMRAVEDKPAA